MTSNSLDVAELSRVAWAFFCAVSLAAISEAQIQNRSQKKFGSIWEIYMALTLWGRKKGDMLFPLVERLGFAVLLGCGAHLLQKEF